MATKTVLQLLQEKAHNFRTLLESHSPDADVRKMITGFNENMLVLTIQVSLIPLQKAGKLPETAAQILDKLTAVPEDQKQALKDKLRRYLECFCELASKI
jgi:hypothetical protein